MGDCKQRMQCSIFHATSCRFKTNKMKTNRIDPYMAVWWQWCSWQTSYSHCFLLGALCLFNLGSVCFPSSVDFNKTVLLPPCSSEEVDFLHLLSSAQLCQNAEAKEIWLEGLEPRHVWLRHGEEGVAFIFFPNWLSVTSVSSMFGPKVRPKLLCLVLPRKARGVSLPFKLY